MRRSNHRSLPNELLSASSKEAHPGGERQWMGETTDLHGLWLFLLCVLSENMVRVPTGAFRPEKLILGLKGTGRIPVVPLRSPRSS
jgi:hypothetical protein